MAVDYAPDLGLELFAIPLECFAFGYPWWKLPFTDLRASEDYDPSYPESVFYRDDVTALFSTPEPGQIPEQSQLPSVDSAQIEGKRIDDRTERARQASSAVKPDLRKANRNHTVDSELDETANSPQPSSVGAVRAEAKRIRKKFDQPLRDARNLGRSVRALDPEKVLESRLNDATNFVGKSVEFRHCWYHEREQVIEKVADAID